MANIHKIDNKKSFFLQTEVADLHSVISYKTGAKPWQFAFLGQKSFAYKRGAQFGCYDDDDDDCVLCFPARQAIT